MYKCRKTLIATGISLAIGVLSPLSSAVAGELDDLRQEILNLKHKVERLEKDRTPLVTKETMKDEEETQWFENVTLSGAIEVEAGYADTPDGDESDIVVATVEVGIDAQVTPWVNAHLLFLYEDGMDSPEVDEAIITIANEEKSPWFGAFGRMYVPFGNFESNLVSDPLTLEIAETREDAAQAGFVSGDFYASAYLFNGDTNDGGSDHIDQFGFNLGLAHEASDGNMGYAVGFSWINNMADSDTLQETVSDPDNLNDEIGGIGIHGLLEIGSIMLIAEYTGATESFDAADLEFDGSGAKPQAWNLEADYLFQIMGKEAVVGVAWQGTKEALALELPETRVLAAISVEIFENTALSLEYAHDEDYSTSEGGSGDDADTFTLQLATSF